MPRLDDWLVQLFADAHLGTTCEVLATAVDPDEAAELRAAAARRRIVDCDSRLAKYRQALDAGADAAVVPTWMAEVPGERHRAERERGESVPADKLTKSQVLVLVLKLRDFATVLKDSRTEAQADVYAELGVEVKCNPEERMLLVSPGPTVYNK